MNGQSYTLSLPDDIAPGDYLIRHEIISLQIALSVGGAEFYPSCTQVRVGGNEDGTPSPTVHFPGAYSDTDPGIYTPNVRDFPCADCSASHNLRLNYRSTTRDSFTCSPAPR